MLGLLCPASTPHIGALEWESGLSEERGTVLTCKGLNDWCLLGFFNSVTIGREQEQKPGWAS